MTHIKYSTASQYSTRIRSGHQDRLVEKFEENYSQQRKKKEDLPLGNSLDSRSDAGEEIKQRVMPVDADSHSADILCPHSNYCNIKEFGNQDCLDYKNCQTYKYYQRYGEGYNALGVGS